MKRRNSGVGGGTLGPGGSGAQAPTGEGALGPTEPWGPQSGPADPELPGPPAQGLSGCHQHGVPPFESDLSRLGTGGQASPCGQFCTLSRGLTRGKALRGLPSRSQGLCQLPETDVESEGEKKRQRASILNLME